MTQAVNKHQATGRSGIDSPLGVVRMALVIACSLAVLVAMPSWLRSLEAAHSYVGEDSQDNLLTDSDSTSSTLAGPKVDSTHLVLADSLGKRYRVSKEALERFIRLAYSAGQMTKIDPLLILAVMAVESSFNPIAESVMGAKGLMQIIPEFHQDKLVGPGGSVANVLDPETNILAGAKVLREYASRTGEDLVAALRLYGGAGTDPRNPIRRRSCRNANVCSKSCGAVLRG
jgi:soluble lytic murein transglycosylase-like protein